jgi:hypothetical protein
MQNRRPPSRRYAFGFDAIMSRPDYRRFQDWYSRTSFFAPKRGELDAMLSEPESRS